MKTFVISDTHFRHENIIKYCDRPFKDANHMNEVMINNWNSVVTFEDRIIHCGDFGLGRYPEEITKIIDRLAFSEMILCKGNHDHKNFWKVYKENPRIFCMEHWFVYYPERIYFSHYPTDKVHGDMEYHIHGHVHNHGNPQPNKFNASVEMINYTPMLLDDIINILRGTPLGNDDRSQEIVEAEKLLQAN